MATVKLMKGTARSNGDKKTIQPNDIGLIFAVGQSARHTAEKYCSWGNDGRIVHFEIDDSNIANLNNIDIARAIAEEYCTFGGIAEDQIEAFAAELVDNDGGDEITIMDDFNFIKAIDAAGYHGATQSGQWCLIGEWFEDIQVTEVENQ